MVPLVGIPNLRPSRWSTLLYQLGYIGFQKNMFTNVNHGGQRLKLTGRCVNGLVNQMATFASPGFIYARMV